MLCLRGSVGERGISLPLLRSRSVLGSGVDADLRLRDPTVSRTHAEIELGERWAIVRDLDSKNGTSHRGARVKQCELEIGDVIVFGSVSMRLEEAHDGDLEAAVLLPAEGPETEAEAEEASLSATLGLQPLHAVLLELIPEVVTALLDGEGATSVAQRTGAGAVQRLPLVSFEIEEEGALVFSAQTADDDEGHLVERWRGAWLARARIRRASSAHLLEPVLDTLLGLVALAGQRPRSRVRLAAPEAPAAPEPPPPPSLVPEVIGLYHAAARVARGDLPVLIEGESGTGKELLAQYLHQASGRATPMVSINCAALPRELLEAELFGVEKGTATGVEGRPGKFELAHSGTLFLDEIAEMVPELQAKLLRVVQEGVVFRLGGSAPRPAKPRLIAATNRRLTELLAAGALRPDLYHRLAGWRVEVPALRRRARDIPNLAAHFLAEEGVARRVSLRGISRRALQTLVAHDWPGNIRELRLQIKKAALFLEEGGLLTSEHLDLERPDRPTELKALLEETERIEIERALAETGNSVTEAAKKLGVHRTTLYRRMGQLGI